MNVVLQNPIPIPIRKGPLAAPSDARMRDILRVRAGPGYAYEILGRLPANKVIEILARTADRAWLQIAYPNAEGRAAWACPACPAPSCGAQCAWVASEFITPKTGLDALPVIISLPSPTPTQPPTATATPESSATAPQDNIPYESLPPWY